MSSDPVCESAAPAPGQALLHAQASAIILSRASGRLPARHAAAVDVSQHFMVSMAEEMAAWARSAAAELRAGTSGRVKALEAMAEAAEVSRKQLEALASMCEAAASSGNPWVMRAALDAISAARPLLCASPSAADPAMCGVDIECDAALRVTEECCGVVIGVTAVCEGAGLQRAASSSNSFRVVCTNDEGNALESVCSDDVDVCVSGGIVSSCDVVAPGTVEVCYVCDAGVTTIVLDVTAFGSPVPGSPWTVRIGFAGECVSSFGLVRGDAASTDTAVSNVNKPVFTALAVSDDQSCIAVCNIRTKSVAILTLPGGEELRTWRVTERGMRSPLSPHFLCFSGASASSLLIAGEYPNQTKNRLLEYSTGGARLRAFPLPRGHDFISGVATHGNLVVALACYIVPVQQELIEGSFTFSSIYVFDYASATLLRAVSGLSLPRDYRLVWSRGLHISADGVVTVGDSDGTVESKRKLVLRFQLTPSHDIVPCERKPLPLDNLPISVAVSEDGALMAVVECPHWHRDKLYVEFRDSLSADAAPVIIRVGEDWVPRALVYSHGHLYVLCDSLTGGGQVFRFR